MRFVRPLGLFASSVLVLHGFGLAADLKSAGGYGLLGSFTLPRFRWFRWDAFVWFGFGAPFVNLHSLALPFAVPLFGIFGNFCLPSFFVVFFVVLIFVKLGIRVIGPVFGIFCWF